MERLRPVGYAAQFSVWWNGKSVPHFCHAYFASELYLKLLIIMT